ncbi:GNAT family N-acetyltransferase [Methylobacterium sp. A54F]
MRDNPASSRFELDVGGMTVFANYRRRTDTLVITYVYAPPALRGTGAADRLMEAVAELARGDGLRIEPLCGYAAAWLRRSAAHRDLVGPARGT